MKKLKKKIKIFITEDDPDDRSFIEKAFNSINLSDSIKFFENGQELINCLKHKKEKPDIIFIDINMPVLNGIQSIEKIKLDKDLKKIPIIVFTSSKNKEDIFKTYEIGVSSYIVKPFTYEELLLTIKNTTNYYFDTAILPTDDY